MLKYKVGLCDYSFTNDYANTRLFETATAQKTYFEDKIAEFYPLSNFNAGNLNRTTQNINIGTTNLLTALNKNYCVIKSEDNSEYYYYFITKSRQDSGQNITLELELDIMQTYYLSLTFSDSIINRAHLERFIDNGDSTYTLNYFESSKLHKNEPLKFSSQYLKSRERLIPEYSTEEITGTSGFNNFLNNNIRYWVYLFVEHREYTFTGANGVDYTFTPDNISSQEYEAELSCFVAPLYTGINNIFIKYTPNGSETEFTTAWNFSAFYRQFKAKNNNNAYVYDIKVSHIAPFASKTYGTAGQIPVSYSNGNMVLNYGEMPSSQISPYFSLIYQTNFMYSVANVSKIPQTYICKFTHKKFTFTKAELEAFTEKQQALEIKLLQAPQANYRLTDGTTNFFDYDISKLGENDAIKYTESLQAGINKGYARFSGINNTLYNEETANNLTGLLINKVQDLPLVNTQYSSYLANNKNAQLTGLVLPLAQTAAGVGTAIMTGGITAAAGAGAAGAGAGRAINYFANIDNLKNAPSSYKDGGHDIIFQSAFQKLGIYLEEYTIADKEKAELFDYLYKNGYALNELGNIKDYDRTRKNFNFIQADIENIESSISNDTKEKIKEIFRNGIRLWHIDTINYSAENLERSVINGE